MIAFIDESGDEGTGGRGTRWLTFGCVCVSASEAAGLDGVMNAIRTRWGGAKAPPVHFKNLTHPDKYGALTVAAATAWTGIIIASDTTKLLPGSWLNRPKFQYNYALRYVVERVSTLAQQWQEPATIFIEARRNFNLTAFRQYLALLARRGEARIDWTRIDPSAVHLGHRSTHPSLCLADGVAHASFKALEPDRKWGLTDPRYLEIITPRLYRGPQRQNLYEYGFIVMPTSTFGGVAAANPWIKDMERNAPLR